MLGKTNTDICLSSAYVLNKANSGVDDDATKGVLHRMLAGDLD